MAPEVNQKLLPVFIFIKDLDRKKWEEGVIVFSLFSVNFDCFRYLVDTKTGNLGQKGKWEKK